MSVLGLGVDLVEIARIETMLERHGERALKRLLTPAEQEYCLGRARPPQHVAARVAAKEATFKALQAVAGAAEVSWLDIEVRVDRSGRPHLELHGRAHSAAERLAATRPFISISHSMDTAIAVVILNGPD